MSAGHEPGDLDETAVLTGDEIACRATAVELRMTAKQRHRMRTEREAEVAIVRDQILSHRRPVERLAIRRIVVEWRLGDMPDRWRACHAGDVPMRLIPMPRQRLERTCARKTFEIAVRELRAARELSHVRERT